MGKWTGMPELFFKTQCKYSVSASDETGGEGDLSDTQKDTIDKVIEHYGSHDAQWLSQLTHMEDPWIKAREGVPAGLGCNNMIAKESMALYYGGL
nr:type II toxin-antitoxin system antitoxin SocA domain-containing protein [uncultured Acetatifactor sp.]